MQRIPKVCMHARVLTHIYTHTLLLLVLLLQLYYNFNEQEIFIFENFRREIYECSFHTFQNHAQINLRTFLRRWIALSLWCHHSDSLGDLKQRTEHLHSH